MFQCMGSDTAGLVSCQPLYHMFSLVFNQYISEMPYKPSEQTVQTQVWLLVKKQSDQDLVFYSFCIF